jgi:hypothetical protein
MSSAIYPEFRAFSKEERHAIQFLTIPGRWKMKVLGTAAGSADSESPNPSSKKVLSMILDIYED